MTVTHLSKNGHPPYHGLDGQPPSQGWSPTIHRTVTPPSKIWLLIPQHINQSEGCIQESGPIMAWSKYKHTHIDSLNWIKLSFGEHNLRIVPYVKKKLLCALHIMKWSIFLHFVFPPWCKGWFYSSFLSSSSFRPTGPDCILVIARLLSAPIQITSDPFEPFYFEWR